MVDEHRSIRAGGRAENIERFTVPDGRLHRLRDPLPEDQRAGRPVRGAVGPARAAGVARRGRVFAYLVVLRGFELAFYCLAAMASTPSPEPLRHRARVLDAGFSSFFRTAPVARAWEGAQGATPPKISTIISARVSIPSRIFAAQHSRTAFSQRTDTASPI